MQLSTDYFEPTIRNGNIYARGLADDKGQMYMHVKAVQALAKYVAENPGKLKADVALVSDTNLYAEGLPTLCIGLRGLVYMEIEATDFNRDGAQDIYQVLGGAYPGDAYKSVLLSNPGHANHWLGLKLEGVDSNRSAIGARVAVEVSTATGSRTIHRAVNSGTSFGDSPLELHIGLGGAKSISKVEVQWPTGKTSIWRGLTLDGAFRLRENNLEAKRIPYTKFAFLNEDRHVH